ncbi:MAG: metalloregulator ArsR/SmtB family transcription factor [Anaerolineales bacterium]|nr:metalloregulator ArsR/SmtB family transcription factor [Anaerolineales bacterium]
MVEHTASGLDSTFAALAHPTRRDLLRRLASGEATVSELATPYDVSLAAVSKHLQVLERAGLVNRDVQGRQHILSLQAAPMRDAVAWLVHYREFWDRSLDALEDLVEAENR